MPAAHTGFYGHRESAVTSIRGIRGLIPRRLRLPAALGAGATGVVAVAVLVHVLAGGPDGGRDTDSISGGARAAVQPALVAFNIAGDASGLIGPGVSVPIDVTVTNSHETAMTVSALRLVVRAVDAPGADVAHPCGVDDFDVVQVANDREIVVPPGATSTLSGLGIPPASWPQVGMRNRAVNQDGCKGVSLTLGYTASAKVSQP